MRFKRHFTTFILAAILAVNVLAATIVSQATANESPDTGQAGSAAVTTISNTGHASTNVADDETTAAQVKTARWFTFQSVSGVITKITLKFDWTTSGAGVTANAPGGGDSANGNASFNVSYSTNNGSSWTTKVNRTFNALCVLGPCSQNTSTSDSGSETQDIPANTPISQIQVRNTITGGNSTASGAGTSSSSMNAVVSNIQLVVTTQDAQLVIMMDEL